MPGTLLACTLKMVDVARQVEIARSKVLAVRDEDAAVFVVTGSDRVSWLNGIVTCDLAKRSPGDAVYGLVVERKGRVMADVAVVLDAERVVATVPRAVAEEMREHFDRHLVMEDAEVRREDFPVWWLHGPRAADVLRQVRAAAAGAAGGEIARTGLGEVVVIGGDPSGAARAAGGAVGDDAGWEALRIERAVPRFGRDFGVETYPQEAGLEKTAVSFDKGCYLGQEVVCMLEMRGHVKRRLAQLIVEGDLPAVGAPVADEAGTRVGHVTSATASPTLRKSVALAMIQRSLAEAGKHLVVAGVRAHVAASPA